MRHFVFPGLLMLAVSQLPLTAEPPVVSGLFSDSSHKTPVQFQYTCATTTGTLPTCSTSFTIPNGKRLTVLNVSGSAKPLNPVNGVFPNGQASATITTQLNDDSPVPNIIGPNYALANSNTWFYNYLLTLFTDIVPVVANNGGPVYIQGYLSDK